MQAVAKTLLFLFIGLLIYFLSLKVGKILSKYKREYQPIASIEPDNSLGFNLIYRVIFTPITLIIIKAILNTFELYYITSNFWIISIIVASLQIMTLLLINRITLVNFKLYIPTIFTTIALSYYLTESLGKNGIKWIIPSEDSLKLEVIIAVITFIYGIFRQIPENSEDYDNRINRYIHRQYKKLNKRYCKELHNYNTQTKKIILSLMIYEDYNRPKLIRVVEKIINSQTSDILQTKSSTSDKESIRKNVNKIKYLYGNPPYGRKKISKIFEQHNPESRLYKEQLLNIYEQIKDL